MAVSLRPASAQAFGALLATAAIAWIAVLWMTAPTGSPLGAVPQVCQSSNGGPIDSAAEILPFRIAQTFGACFGLVSGGILLRSRKLGVNGGCLAWALLLAAVATAAGLAFVAADLDRSCGSA